jgi:hypothetical protein
MMRAETDKSALKMWMPVDFGAMDAQPIRPWRQNHAHISWSRSPTSNTSDPCQMCVEPIGSKSAQHVVLLIMHLAENVPPVRARDPVHDTPHHIEVGELQVDLLGLLLLALRLQRSLEFLRRALFCLLEMQL